MSFRIIIPARFDSTRLPGKVLLDIAGKPMLQHVYDIACQSGAKSVVIASDHQAVNEFAQSINAPFCLTAASHQSGTERAAEVIDKMAYADEDIIVNLQADEPLIPKELPAQVAQDLNAQQQADVATLSTPILDSQELFDPHVTKVVCDAEGYALYFSRAAIPANREQLAAGIEQLSPSFAQCFHRHIGLYAQRAGFIKRYVAWQTSPLEQLERLEQLRILWHGGRIHVAQACKIPLKGVDTEADLVSTRALFEKSSLQTIA